MGNSSHEIFGEPEAAQPATPGSHGEQPLAGAGDSLPPRCEVIQIRVGGLFQLFNAMDPSPFRTRDLRADVEEFIVGWAREAPRDRPLALRVHLDGPPDALTGPDELREAIHGYFRNRADGARRRLRLLFRVGRTSLLIGLVCLTTAAALADLVEHQLPGTTMRALLRESLLIGGWVAMWRPLETFLYDWWPIRAEERLFERLAAMPVRVEARQTSPP